MHPPTYEPANPYRDTKSTLDLLILPAQTTTHHHNHNHNLAPPPPRLNRYAPPRFSSRLRTLVQSRVNGGLRIHLVSSVSEKPLPQPQPETAPRALWLWGVVVVVVAGVGAGSVLLAARVLV